jgi:hypothetical protein
MTDYEAALREIAAIPCGRHVTLPDAPAWDNTTFVADGYDRCIEIARRALGIEHPQESAHPLDLCAQGRSLLESEEPQHD